MDDNSMNGFGGYSQPVNNNGGYGFNQPSDIPDFGGYNQLAANPGFGGYEQPAADPGFGGFEQPAADPGFGGFEQPLPDTDFTVAGSSADKQQALDRDMADFEQAMSDRLAGFTAPNESEGGAGNERLREMNKKLPSWSLEPPYSFLK